MLIGGSVVKRSHGQRHQRLLDTVRFACAAIVELTMPRRDKVNCPAGVGQALQAST
jgi:hypothetical protein